MSHDGSAYEDYLRTGAALYGTPAQVVDQIGRLHELAAIDNLLCFMSVRAMDPAKVMRSMELFAATVMPHFSAAPVQVSDQLSLPR